MTLDEALEMLEPICAASFAAMGLGAPPAVAARHNIGLADLLEARRVIEAENQRPTDERGGKTLHVVPDDRLIAAYVTAQRYEPSREPVLVLGDRVLAVVPASALRR